MTASTRGEITRGERVQMRVAALLALILVAGVVAVATSRSVPGRAVLGEADALAMAEADFTAPPKGSQAGRVAAAEENAADSAATKLVDEAFARAMAGLWAGPACRCGTEGAFDGCLFAQTPRASR